MLSFAIDQSTKAYVPIHGVEIDAVAELWYEDKAALARAGSRPEMGEILKNGAKYLGGIKTIITEEVDII